MFHNHNSLYLNLIFNAFQFETILYYIFKARDYDFKQGLKCSRESIILADFACHYLAIRAACLLLHFQLFGSSFYFFLTLTTPAGVIQNIQSSAETPCFTFKQIHPFTAEIGSPVMSMKLRIYLFSLRLAVLLKGKLLRP